MPDLGKRLGDQNSGVVPVKDVKSHSSKPHSWSGRLSPFLAFPMELSESSFFGGGWLAAEGFQVPRLQAALGQLCIGESLKSFAIDPESISPRSAVFALDFPKKQAALLWKQTFHPREPFFGCLYCACFI